MKVPSVGVDDMNSMDRSASTGSATGPLNVTVTGCATPTGSPAEGRMLSTSTGVVLPADAVASELAIAIHAPTARAMAKVTT